MALSTTLSFFTLSTASPRMEVRASISRGLKVSCVKPQVTAELGGNGFPRRKRTRRALSKKGEYIEYRKERVPFLEELKDARIARQDVGHILRSAGNRYGLILELAAEATKLVENDKDRFAHMNPLLHAVSDRMNEAGVYTPDAYYRSGPIRIQEM